MKCPKCENEMVPGEVGIETSPIRFLLVGLSANTLKFSSKQLDRKISLLDSRPLLRSRKAFSRVAHHCQTCGSTFMEGS